MRWHQQRHLATLDLLCLRLRRAQQQTTGLLLGLLTDPQHITASSLP
jgi:hypothetical protein